MNDGALHRALLWALGTSYGVTLTAWGAALALVWPQIEAGFDGKPETVVNWSGVIGSLLLAWAGRLARSNNVSSEQAGIVPKTPMEQVIQRVSLGERIESLTPLSGPSVSRAESRVGPVGGGENPTK